MRARARARRLSGAIYHSQKRRDINKRFGSDNENGGLILTSEPPARRYSSRKDLSLTA